MTTAPASAPLSYYLNYASGMQMAADLPSSDLVTLLARMWAGTVVAVSTVVFMSVSSSFVVFTPASNGAGGSETPLL
jgi:hypothetical protein